MRLKHFIATISIATLLSACAPNPRAPLTEAQRKADMEWLLTKIESQYAPLQYKEKLYNFKYAELREKYLADAAPEQTNEEFYRLMFKLVAEFKDAHFSATLTRSPLPGRSSVTYLGFRGIRKGEAFKVQKFLDTFTSLDNYPVKVDDEILEINGKKLRDAVNEELAPLRNLGNDEANFTMLAGSLFLRSSMNFPVTTEGMARLKLKRDKKILEVEVPWITKDYVTFSKEQSAAAAKKAQQSGKDLEQETAETLQLLQTVSMHQYISEGQIRHLLAKSGSSKELMENFLAKSAKLTTLDTFEFKQLDPISDVIEVYALLEKKFSAAEEKKKEETPLEKLKKVRYTPTKLHAIEAAKTYPAYVGIFEQDKKREVIGYIQIDTFSPQGDEKEVLKEVKATLDAFRDFGEKGVDRIVLDLINNGGGSLSLGLKMAQLLSHEQIRMPDLQVRLNDSWVDGFQQGSLAGGNDANAEMSRMIYEVLLKGLQGGDSLSAKIPSDSIIPFGLKPNSDLKIFDEPMKLKLVVAVNEMCASMCDIFTSILKDNKMATILGKQTMGAGGNVVQHRSAPNSGLMVNLTESLIFSPDGEYLENNGVKPDVEIETTESSDEKYKAVIKKAVEILTKN